MTSTFFQAATVFASMLSSTLLVPALRPFFAAYHGGAEGPVHAFVSLNMLGAVVGAPLLGLAADQRFSRRSMAVVLAVLDAALLLLCSLPLPTGLVLVIRTLQGAVNVGALSIIMGALGRLRSESQPGSSMGLMGACVIAAVAAGTPLGTLLMQVDVALPMRMGAVSALVAAALAYGVIPKDSAPSAPRQSLGAVLREYPLLRTPALWLAVERFTVGSFVVTFSLYAHHVLELSDTSIGVLYTWFLLPFAVFTWPMGRLCEKVGATLPLGLGALVYGACFMVLGHLGAQHLPWVLCTCGVASGALYAGALHLGATWAPPSRRSTSMGLLNAAGTLGMMLGTAMAGVGSAVLQSQGLSKGDAYALIFSVAGAVQWVALLASAGVLLRGDRLAAAKPAV